METTLLRSPDARTFISGNLKPYLFAEGLHVLRMEMRHVVSSDPAGAETQTNTTSIENVFVGDISNDKIELFRVFRAQAFICASFAARVSRGRNETISIRYWHKFTLGPLLVAK